MRFHVEQFLGFRGSQTGRSDIAQRTYSRVDGGCPRHQFKASKPGEIGVGSVEFKLPRGTSRSVSELRMPGVWVKPSKSGGDINLQLVRDDDVPRETVSRDRGVAG